MQSAGYVFVALFVVGGAVAVAGEAVDDAPAGKGAAKTDAKTEAENAPSFVKEGKIDLDAVVKHFEDLYRSTSSIAVAELTVTRPRHKRAMRMKIWTHGTDKALVVIEAPPREKGTATLKKDKNLWNYLPRIKRTIRIPPSMMLSPWMGSDFTNDDLVRESSFHEDYTYELMGKEEKGWRIRFTAKPDIVGLWNRLDLVVTSDGMLPVEAEYYDRKDRLARTIRWEDVKVFDGKRVPTRLVLTPKDKEGHQTVMIYEELHFKVDVPESTFSLTRLERKGR